MHRIGLRQAAEISDRRYRRLLRARRARQRDYRSAKRDNKFSAPDVDCDVTLPQGWGTLPCFNRMVCG